MQNWIDTPQAKLNWPKLSVVGSSSSIFSFLPRRSSQVKAHKQSSSTFTDIRYLVSSSHSIIILYLKWANSLWVWLNFYLIELVQLILANSWLVVNWFCLIFEWYLIEIGLVLKVIMTVFATILLMCWR